MRINAIYCINTNEILYSRCAHDYRSSECKECAVDGGFDYFKVVGNPSGFAMIQLDGEYLLKYILGSDYLYTNSNSDKFTHGYHGRFQIVPSSNLKFYESLILNYNDVKHYIEKVVQD